MKAKRRKAARTRSSVSDQAASFSLLGLPVEVLHQVLSMLAAHDLVQLLQTSKAMVQEVMQHAAGRLTLKVALYKGVNWAVIRQMLQWAPPSSLKLCLKGVEVWPGYPGCYRDTAKADFSKLSQLLNMPCSALPAPGTHQGHHKQQFDCVSKVCIQGFTLPNLVPAGLAVLFPNMQTLHLAHVLVDGSHHTGSDSNTTSSSSSSSSAWPAPSLHTLVLEACTVPGWMDLPLGRSRATRGAQRSAQHADQLKSSLPNLTCLKVLDCPVAMQFIAMLGPQLVELHLPSSGEDLSNPSDVSDIRWPTAAMHLQQLQTLMLPDVEISSAADMEHLLSLPSVTHLEINSLGYGLQDYSSHPCKWQHLHLRLAGKDLWLESLARLPLHSLTHPLVLGFKGSKRSVTLCLPPSDEDYTLPAMERLAQQLTTCGVHLLAAGVAWDSADPHWIHVTYQQPIVYGSSPKQLVFEDCTFEADMLPAWQAALSGLPAVDRVDLSDCRYDTWNRHTESRLVRVVQPLATAMAQQPAGRCIEVAPDECPDRVKEFAAAHELAGVEVTAVETTGNTCGVGMCLHLRSKHML